MAPNKSLAAQLAAEFRELFPKNRVEYFVSYYDYYQPEAYLPSTDTYIEKDSSINDEIDRLRHSATSALLVPAGRHHRRVGVRDLRPRLAGDVRQTAPDARGGRRARPAVDPAPARRAAVRAQRHGVHAEQVPRARRHDRGVPGLRGEGAADLAVRRRGRAHRAVDPLTGEIVEELRLAGACSRPRTTSPTRSG